LQRGPICFGPCTEENWISIARDKIQTRISNYESSEIRFNLLAVIGDKIDQLNKELIKATQSLAETNQTEFLMLKEDLEQRIQQEKERRA